MFILFVWLPIFGITNRLSYNVISAWIILDVNISHWIPVFLINLVFHYKNKADIGHYLSSINELSKARVISKKLIKLKIISSYFKEISFLKDINIIKFSTEFIRFEKKFDSEFYFLIWIITELIKITFSILYFSICWTKDSKSLTTFEGIQIISISELKKLEGLEKKDT